MIIELGGNWAVAVSEWVPVLVTACLINKITNREGRFFIELCASHQIPGHGTTPRTLPSRLAIRLDPNHRHQFPIQGEFVGGERVSVFPAHGELHKGVAHRP
jgi:hypothetical protein